MNYSPSHPLIGELSRKKIHNHTHEHSIIKESSIIIQDIIWEKINRQRNFDFEKGFSCSYKEHSDHTK